MIKIINKGLNELGAKEMTKLFKDNAKEFPEDNWIFKVGMKIGKTSKIQQKFNPNTTMGTYYRKTRNNNVISIPLNWLHYELIEYKIVKRTIV
jgi:hypothetical protein